MLNKILSVLILLFAGINLVYAAEVVINKDLKSFFTETPQRTANATCFMYPNNQYKCACRFSNNKKIWASGEISQILGLSTGTKTGIIKECTD